MHHEPAERHANLLAIRLIGLTGLAGITAALLGGWMLVGPSDGRLTIAIPGLLAQTWNATELGAMWAAPLLIIGGLVAGGAFGWIARTSRATSRPGGERFYLVLAIAGLVATLIGASQLI